MSYRYDFQIGTQAGGTGGMVNVETLSLNPPYWAYKPYQEIVRLGDGNTRGVGFPSALWRWGFLSNEQREELRVFCPGTSAEVYIQTKTGDTDVYGVEEYKVFEAIMHWPNEEDAQGGAKLDFSIVFSHLVEVIP